MNAPVVRLSDASLAFGKRMLWDTLDLTVDAGEFIAILGPNGSGKTSLLKVLTGQLALTSGSADIAGQAVSSGNDRVGYIPQHSATLVPTMRGRDLVALGVDGHRWGLAARPRVRHERDVAVGRAIEEVGAAHYARAPLTVLSGGERQRLRIAQALAGDPILLLCDEPLLNLDPASAQQVSELIDKRRRDASTAVLFVTHEINPVLPFVDRVLYLVDGRFRVGTVEEVMTSENLSQLYRTEVDVVCVRGQYVVVGNRGFCHE
ncbi:MAG: zinc/manganese transport system ATP-binding protein [Mycobacterium sp.]|nr:zinc/manganese transport system ATP-binding protein [Mycobacterium sp.]